MPLPLPDLDTRRWSDLVEEGLALVPRYAPRWTDHNLHDPGVTLIELFAWLVEQGMYRANRVPDRHRLKFLSLIGYPPRPPRGARVMLGATLIGGTGMLDLPAGLVLLATSPGQAPMPFTTIASTTLVEGDLVSLQVHDGKHFVDRTSGFRDRSSIEIFGPEPGPSEENAHGPALYVGFDRAWPVGETASLYFRFEHGDHDTRRRLLDEAAALADDCRPLGHDCPPGTKAAEDPANDQSTEEPEPGLPPHHSVRLVWEVLEASGWRELEPTMDEVVDDTRSLTLDGEVRFRLPAPTVASVVGQVSAPLHWIRSRVAEGAYDEAPSLLSLLLNPLVARQSIQALGNFPVGAGVAASTPVAVGDRLRLAPTLDSTGAFTALDAAAAGVDAPELLVVDYRTATPTDPGEMVVPLRPLLTGDGLPEQHARLGDAPVDRGEVGLWGAETGRWQRWAVRSDLDASGPLASDVVVEATEGDLLWGDGVNGRVLPAGSLMCAAWSSTMAEAGNIPPGREWTLAGAPNGPHAPGAAALNRALIGGDPASVAGSLALLANPDPASGGADRETLGEAAARAAEQLWAHERLVELCGHEPCETLDQLEPSQVMRRSAPPRAVSALDFERIALDVPGTRVRRARAWPGVDPRYACMQAPGTVTLVVVPALPSGRPYPTPGLLRAVRRYLEPRRSLCTRLVLTGPCYRVVHVHARVQACVGVDPDRVRRDVLQAIEVFLDPLVGGPAGRGWPFGRDVYRSEVMHLLDTIPGVEHVLDLELAADDDETGCGDVCVGATGLTASGDHPIEVAAG